MVIPNEVNHMEGNLHRRLATLFFVFCLVFGAVALLIPAATAVVNEGNPNDTMAEADTNNVYNFVDDYSNGSVQAPGSGDMLDILKFPLAANQNVTFNWTITTMGPGHFEVLTSDGILMWGYGFSADDAGMASFYTPDNGDFYLVISGDAVDLEVGYNVSAVPFYEEKPEVDGTETFASAKWAEDMDSNTDFIDPWLDTLDFWKFNVTAGQLIDIDVAYTTAGTDFVGAYLYSAADNTSMIEDAMWVNGSTGSSISYTAATTGVYYLLITGRNVTAGVPGYDEQATAGGNYTVDFSIMDPNAAPVLGTNNPVAIDEEAMTAVDLNALVTDPNMDDLTFTIIGTPTLFDASINATEWLEITGKADMSGDEDVTINATDGSLSIEFNITVQIAAVDDKPMFVKLIVDDTDKMPEMMNETWYGGAAAIEPIVNLTTDEDMGFMFEINATDVDTDLENLTFTVSKDDSMAPFTVEANATMPWWYTFTPDADANGVMNFTVEVKDASSTNGDEGTFTHVMVDVGPVNDGPVFSFSAGFMTLADFFDPNHITFTPNGAEDPEGDEVTYMWDWGDGSAVFETNMTTGANHTYDLIKDDMNYTVNLSLKDSNGAMGEWVTMNVSIDGVPGGPRTWDLGAMPADFDDDLWIDTLIDVTIDEAKSATTIEGTSGSTVYNFAGTCSDTVTEVHLYVATQINDTDYTYYKAYDMSLTPMEHIVIELDGVTAWNYTYTYTFDYTPPTDGGDGGDGGDGTTYTTWYAAVAWDDTGAFNYDELEATIETGPSTPEPTWWALGVGDADIETQDDYASTVAVTFDKCDIITTAVDNGDGTSTATTVYTFEGTCGSDVTVIYIYFGSQTNDDAYTYYAFTDLDTMSKLEITPSGGAWSYTYTTDPVTYDNPTTTDGGDGGDGGTPDVYHQWYMAVAWSEEGYGVDELEANLGGGTDGGDGGDGGDGDDNTMMLAGIGGGVVCLVLLIIIIIIIVVVVMMMKKKKGAAAAEEPPAEGAPPVEGEVAAGPAGPEGEVQPGMEGQPPAEGEAYPPVEGGEAYPPAEGQVEGSPMGEQPQVPEGEQPGELPPAEGEAPVDAAAPDMAAQPEAAAADPAAADPAAAAAPAAGAPICPDCGQPGRFIEEYNANWCDACQKYIQ